jgi:hypothetical protein
VATLWAGSHVFDGDAALVLFSGGLGLAAAVLSRRWLAHEPRRLVWDGQVWAVQGADNTLQRGRATLMLDLGRWMLVRFVPGATPRVWPAAAVWLPLREREVGTGWLALRVTLYAQQTDDDAPHPAA